MLTILFLISISMLLTNTCANAENTQYRCVTWRSSLNVKRQLLESTSCMRCPILIGQWVNCHNDCTSTFLHLAKLNYIHSRKHLLKTERNVKLFLSRMFTKLTFTEMKVWKGVSLKGRSNVISNLNVVFWDATWTLSSTESDFPRVSKYSVCLWNILNHEKWGKDLSQA